MRPPQAQERVQQTAVVVAVVVAQPRAGSVQPRQRLAE